MTPTKLLARVSEIRMKHDLIAELTGENFNVFGILGMQTAENRTHSAFLRELLDPKGTHGMGDAFLRAFIRMLRSKYSSSKAFSDSRGFNSVPLIEEHALVAKVVPELNVGCKSADLTEGGKIDLAIIVEWHNGSAGPPSAEEAVQLKNALTNTGS